MYFVLFSKNVCVSQKLRELSVKSQEHQHAFAWNCHILEGVARLQKSEAEWGRGAEKKNQDEFLHAFLCQ